LNTFPDLAKYFEDHLIEGLYMLQFRKVNYVLYYYQLQIPAPVNSPDGQHYLQTWRFLW